MTDELGHVMTRSRWRDRCERAEVGWGVREEGVVRLRVGGTDDGGVSESLGCKAERRGASSLGQGSLHPCLDTVTGGRLARGKARVLHDLSFLFSSEGLVRRRASESDIP